MTEQDLDDPDIGAALQKVGGKAMPKRVGSDRLADPGTLPCGTASRLKCAQAHMIAGLLAWKQPRTRPRPLPIGTKDLQQPRRQHRVTIPATLAARDVDQHPFAVDRADLQAHDLSDAQARCISSRQRNTIAQARHRLQKACSLIRGENRRKLLRLLAGDDALERLLLAECDAVEESQRARDLIGV